MNKKLLIGIILLILVIGGVGAYLMSTKKATSVTQPVKTNNESISNSPKSLKDLVTAGVPQKCTFKGASEEETSGTTYVAGGKMRGDFSTKVENKISEGHMIFDGKTSYVWMEGTTTGFKMEVDPATLSSDDKATQQGLDFNKSMDYKCTAWVADKGVFEPPSEVTFTSFSVPASNLNVTGMNDNTNLCSSCNSLTGEQKTQCLTALKCN